MLAATHRAECRPVAPMANCSRASVLPPPDSSRPQRFSAHGRIVLAADFLCVSSLIPNLVCLKSYYNTHYRWGKHFRVIKKRGVSGCSPVNRASSVDERICVEADP
jgi:hypothetical protein